MADFLPIPVHLTLGYAVGNTRAETITVAIGIAPVHAVAYPSHKADNRAKSGSELAASGKAETKTSSMAGEEFVEQCLIIRQRLAGGGLVIARPVLFTHLVAYCQFSFCEYRS